MSRERSPENDWSGGVDISLETPLAELSDKVISQSTNEMSDAEKGVDDDKAQEEEPNEEQIKKPETIQELLDLWRHEYELASGEQKQELAYRIIKMGEAIDAAHLQADQILIKSNDAGIAGFFDRSTGEVAITPEGIGLPADHYKGVLVHEATHAGKITGRGISDEGLTELITQRVTAVGGEGIYEQERAQTNTTFKHLSIDTVIDAYDFQNPAELLNLYFATEWKIGCNNELQSLITPEMIIRPEARPEFINGPAKDWVQKKEQALQDAAPRLLAEAEQQGFDFKATHVRCLTKVIENT